MAKYIYINILLFLFSTTVSAQYLNQRAIDSLEVWSVGSVNSEASEFSPFLLDGAIVYVAEGDNTKGVDINTEERYWDLRSTVMVSEGKLRPSHYLPSRINSPYHEGPVAYNEKDSSLYFTRDYYINGDLKEGADRKVYLQIFKSGKRGNDWNSAERLSFMDNDFNICHPAIVSDADVMIFASNKPGGYGGMDLYEISLNASSMDEAINLGSEINTAANEVFPFYHESGFLIYASDLQGEDFRQYDMHLTNRNGGYASSEVLAGGFASEQDDLGIYVYPDAKSGYFSSSRIGGSGKDDLYYFKSDEPIFSIEPYIGEPVLTEETVVEEMIDKTISEKVQLNMIIKDKNLRNLDLVNVRILRNDTKELVKMYTNNRGPLSIGSLDQGVIYEIEVEKPGYHTYYRTMFSTEDFEELLVLMEKKNTPPPVVYSEPVREPEIYNPPPKPVVIPVSVGEMVVFENIYYEYNSDQIKEGSADELDALVRAMRKNPTMKVRMAAHTDSRGSDTYNQSLSERRAKTAKEYLVLKGISPQRILTIGLGETQIRNHCKEGVNCSERAHRFNRRTEVQIVEQ